MPRLDVITGHFAGLDLTVLDCATCGAIFGMTPTMVSEFRRSMRGFTCPNGHSNIFPRTPVQDVEKEEFRRRAEAAERELQNEKRLRKFAESSAHGQAIVAGKAKAAARRLLHRVECGVCPHCRRTFKQLAAHIKAKHGRAAS